MTQTLLVLVRLSFMTSTTKLELKDVFAENRPVTANISLEQLVFAPARDRPLTARISRDDTPARSSSIGLTQASAAEVSGTESYSEVHDIVRKLDELKQLKREMEEKVCIHWFCYCIYFHSW